MAEENQRRPEASHRQRVDLGHATIPLDDDGKPMVIVSVSASDLIPTVQFGNVLIQTTITRAVPDSDQALSINPAVIESARNIAQMAQFVVGAERRLLQWAIDPSSRVINPGTGAVVTPDGEKPAQAADLAAEIAAAVGKEPAVGDSPQPSS